MDKKLLLLCLSIAFTCFNIRTAQAAPHCTGLDITFSKVTLTGVGNGKISYDVTINNVGTQTILLSKLTLKNYISSDNTYDGGDASGGMALFSAFASGTSVLAGQQKTATYYATYSGDIKTIGYLIVQLAYQDAECDATNNQIVACTKPEPALNDIAISSLNATEGYYNATIQNKGGDTMFLSKSVIQNYVSTDNTLGSGDAAAGGSILNYGTKQYLLANEIYVVTDFSFNATNLSSYSYVLATLYYTTATACNAGSQLAEELEVTVTSTEDRQQSLSPAVIWDMNTNSFVTKSEAGWSGSMTYRLVDLAGRLLTTGNTTPGERVYLQAGSGMGLLIVSDEKNSYSQKIIR